MKVTISKERYIELLNSDEKLYRLQRGGVDNWDWYGESLSEYKKIIGCDENGENIVYAGQLPTPKGAGN